MKKTWKIVIAVVGGAIVGALGVCTVIWPELKAIFLTASALVTMIIGFLTGISIPEK